jgi:hypothetical protein
MSAAHLAQRLCFDVRFATRELAEAQQEALADFARRRAPAVIDEACEAACDLQTHWRLERLEIDLGQVFADEMELEWERRLRERLTLLLQERAHHESAVASDTTDAPNDTDARFGRRSLPAVALQDLCGFLQSGVLPWSSGSEQELAALVQASLRERGPELSRWLTAHRDGRSRFALQCPTAVAEASTATELRAQFLSNVAAARYEACARMIPQLLPADAVWLRLQLTRMCAGAAARRGLLKTVTEAAWRGICELWLPPTECEALLKLLAHPVLQSAADPVRWREHLCCSLMLADGPVPERQLLLYRLLLHVASWRVEPIEGLIAGLIEPLRVRAKPDDEPLRLVLQGMIDHVPEAIVRSEAGSIAASRLRALRSQVISGLTSGVALPLLPELELLLQHDASWLRAVLSKAGRDAEQRRRCAEAWGMAGWRQCAQWWLPARDAAALCALLTHPRVTAAAEPVELCEYAWRCAVLKYPARGVSRSRLAAALEGACDASEARAQLRLLTQAMLMERPVAEQKAACAASASKPAGSSVPSFEPPERAARRAAARLRLLEAIDAGTTSMSESAWCALWRWLVADDAQWLQGTLLRHAVAAAALGADIAIGYGDAALAELLAPWYASAQRSAVLEQVRHWMQRFATADPARHHDTVLLATLTDHVGALVATGAREPGALATHPALASMGGLAKCIAGTDDSPTTDAALDAGVACLPGIEATTREQLWSRVLARVWSGGTQDAASSEPRGSQAPKPQRSLLGVQLEQVGGLAVAAEIYASLTWEQRHALSLALQGEVRARFMSASQPRTKEQSTQDASTHVPASRSLSEWMIQRTAAVISAPHPLLEDSEAQRTDGQPAELRQTAQSLDRYIVEQVMHALIGAGRQSGVVSQAGKPPLQREERGQLSRSLCAAFEASDVSGAVFAMLTEDQRGLVIQALQPLDHWILQDVVRSLLRAWSAAISPLDAQQRAELEWRFFIQERCVQARVFELDATSRRCLDWLCTAQHRHDLDAVAVRLARWLREERTESGPAELSEPVWTEPTVIASLQGESMASVSANDAVDLDVRDAAEELAQALASVLDSNAVAAIPDVSQEMQTGDALYLDNVGMVLAAPYLPRLFDMLGLLRDDVFVSTDAAQRAVHVLQFMVNGAMTTPEFRLPLNKLLCGLPFALPIMLGVELSVEEQTSIEQLLQAMIQHWSILGSTSLPGLRETFLQRAGRLTRREEDWHLLVEPRPFDVLLDQLPWGYATIKYPWMEQVLHVQWR